MYDTPCASKRSFLDKSDVSYIFILLIWKILIKVYYDAKTFHNHLKKTKRKTRNRILSVANNDDQINIYEVNALLFQIISFMSEAERRKLHAKLISKWPDAGTGKDLSALITSMSEAKRSKLLVKLSNWYHSKNSKLKRHAKFSELRGHPRRPLAIPVELSKNGFTFTCLTQNISNSGAFIQIDYSFHIDQKVSMILSHPKFEKNIPIGGRVARIDTEGIGVKFDELLSVFFKSREHFGSSILTSDL
jgi:Tfp pilus assembly protein PilZ